MPGGDRVPGKKGKGNAYSQDLIAEETLKFIEANRGRRFFCYAAWTLPHGQFEIPDASAFDDRPWNHRVKKHAAMIARLDTDVGRLTAKLEQLGLDDQTLVIFSSDNGADGPGRNEFNGTAGLRGHKRHLYEGGIRTPMIARWPSVIKPGSESDLLTGHVDFLPTACDFAGVRPPHDADGISIAPTLSGNDQATKHRALYWEIYEGPHPFQQAVRMDRWKGYRTALDGPLELYDLQVDPQERSNVAAKHADVVKQIEAVMADEYVRNPHWRPTKIRMEAGKKNRRRAAA
jgi:arylsulfatase A-like enzyme